MVRISMGLTATVKYEGVRLQSTLPPTPLERANTLTRTRVITLLQVLDDLNHWSLRERVRWMI